jgi:signal transduction histidine kinase
MLNLLLNARKAMKKRRGRLSISAQRNGEMVTISVCDRGVGMSREMLDDVVNPFLEADANAKPGDWGAVGLGLHACRTIAQFHGASLRATANDGPGVTFHIAWPAA